MPVSPPLYGFSPVLNSIIGNKYFFSIAKHVIVNICNKPRKSSIYKDFKKSIMSKMVLRHDFEICNHEKPCAVHVFMILSLIKFCKHLGMSHKRHASNIVLI